MAKELEPDLFVCGRPVSLFKFNLFSVAILFVTFSVIIFLRAVSYTHLTLPTNREV